MNNSRTVTQVGSTTCAHEGFSRLESSLSKLALKDFAIYQYIDSKAILVRQQFDGQKQQSSPESFMIKDQMGIGASIVGQAAQLQKTITCTEACFKSKTSNIANQSLTEIAFPVYWEGNFYGVLYVASNNYTDSVQHQLHDILVLQNVLERAYAKPVNSLTSVSGPEYSDEQLESAQKLFYGMLKQMHCQLEFDELLCQFNGLLQINLNANEFKNLLELLVGVYLENAKMKVFGMVLSETFINPVANHQLAVADSLFMAYSTYRRHLCNGKKMLYYEFLKNI